MAQKRQITHADILPPAEYAAKRGALRKQVVALKRNRRIEVGPVATFYFESFETMLQQIQEMLYIEKGGDEQIAGELAAYNPLIPNGKELTATVMFEIDDPIRRQRFLSRLGGVEDTAFIKLDGETVKGVPEADQDRTTAEGKASSVQFIHFPFTPQQIALFREANRQVVIGFSHPEYSHMAVLPEAVRAALAQDFD
ncbi:MAG TPA: DUF3501 family protein [Dongiaceae bacterium]|jgi:hypothetical protein|nr:DUF3501 family protein [Dongiaceae bacterium]